MIIIITTTGFTYSNNIEDTPDYIKEDLLENVNLKDKIQVNLNTKISQEEYETTIKDVENFFERKSCNF